MTYSQNGERMLREREEGLIINSVSKNLWIFSALVLWLTLRTAAFQLPAVAAVLQLSALSPQEYALASGASVFPLVGGSLWLGLTRSHGA